jgi:Pyridoxamine 5'-phosphate oxidase
MAGRKRASGSGAGKTASTKTASKRAKGAEPSRDRPRFPPVYGISKSAKGLLPWSHVDERMRKAMRYWVSSVDPEGRPHATPVDGMWIDGKLYFGGSPTTRRNRNLVANSAACVHLEEAMDVVILHGDARELRDVPRDLSRRIIEHSKEKYGFAPPVDDLGAGGVFVFEPRLGFAWKDFTKDATRFRFASGR